MMNNKYSQTIRKKQFFNLTQHNHTDSDFNSRLILPSTKLPFKFQETPVNKHKISKSVATPEYCNKTEQIKIKLERVLNDREFIKSDRNENKIKLKGTKKMKIVFFKGNYKINKSKRQLQIMNRKAQAEQFQKRKTQTSSSRSSAFIVKQIKPIKVILNNSQAKMMQQKDQDQKYKHFISHLSKSVNKQQNNVRRKQAKNKNQFQRYDDNWYENNQLSQASIFRNYFSSLNKKRKHIQQDQTKNNKQTATYEPWPLAQIEDSFNNLS